MDLSGFQEWRRLDSLSLKDIPEDKWECSFVYVFRKQSTKEVLYIGCTTNLILRMFGNFIAGAGGSTTQRIQALLLEEGFIKDTEVTWKEALDHKSEERRLLESYFEQEGQLPPWNKRF